MQDTTLELIEALVKDIDRHTGHLKTGLSSLKDFVKMGAAETAEYNQRAYMLASNRDIMNRCSLLCKLLETLNK